MGEGVNGAADAAKMAATAQNEVSKGRLGRFKVNYPATTQAIKWLAFTTLVVAVIGGLAALGIGFIPGGDKAITWLTSGSYSGLNNWQLMAVTAAAAAVTGVVTVFTIALVLDRRNKPQPDLHNKSQPALPRRVEELRREARADARDPDSQDHRAYPGAQTRTNVAEAAAEPAAPPAQPAQAPAVASETDDDAASDASGNDATAGAATSSAPAATPTTADVTTSDASANAIAGTVTSSAQVVAVDPAKLKTWIASREAAQSQADAASASAAPTSPAAVATGGAADPDVAKAAEEALKARAMMQEQDKSIRQRATAWLTRKIQSLRDRQERVNAERRKERTGTDTNAQLKAQMGPSYGTTD